VRRRAAHFLVLGAAFLVARSGLSALTPNPRLPLDVEASAESTPEQIRQLGDEAILLAEAERLGWFDTDPTIRQRLVRNMRFLDESTSRDSEAELFARARALDMHERDPIVIRRLWYRFGEHAQSRRDDRHVSEAELRDYVAQHPERFGRPARLRFSQVFLSRERRGDHVQEEATQILERLERPGSPPPEEAHRLGDPMIHRLDAQWADPTTLDERFGPGFGARVAELAVRRWEGPIPSTFGLHLIFVHERQEARGPELDQVRQAARAAIAHDSRARSTAVLLESLRAVYQIRLIAERDRGEH